MSSLDAEGVVDYRNAIESGDKNKAAIILNEAIMSSTKKVISATALGFAQMQWR